MNIMQVLDDTVFQTQNFYEQNFSCKLFLTRNLRRIHIKNIKAFHADSARLDKLDTYSTI